MSSLPDGPGSPPPTPRPLTPDSCGPHGARSGCRGARPAPLLDLPTGCWHSLRNLTHRWQSCLWAPLGTRGRRRGQSRCWENVWFLSYFASTHECHPTQGPGFTFAPTRCCLCHETTCLLPALGPAARQGTGCWTLVTQSLGRDRLHRTDKPRDTEKGTHPQGGRAPLSGTHALVSSPTAPGHPPPPLAGTLYRGRELPEQGGTVPLLLPP